MDESVIHSLVSRVEALEELTNEIKHDLLYTCSNLDSVLMIHSGRIRDIEDNLSATVKRLNGTPFEPGCV